MRTLTNTITIGNRPRDRRVDAGLTVLLVFAVVVFYGRAVTNYWLFDDPQILKHAVDFHPWEYFFIPEAWRKLSDRKSVV